MKDKILFWIDAGLTHFGIAKFLQEKHDCELFAIYDLNHHLKRSFINQKLVDFKKEWYFWNHVSKTEEKPDLKYLASFEERYKINLWNIAYSERLFSRFNQFHRFSSDEILSILEQECRLFEMVLEEAKPDFLMIKLTDFHRNHLLAEMCELRGIRVLMLIQSRFGYRCFISPGINRLDDFCNIENEMGDDNVKLFELQKYMKKFDKFQQSIKIKSGGSDVPILKKLDASLHWMLRTFDDEYKKSYDHYGITRLRAIIKKTSSSLKKQYRKSFIDRKFVYEVKDEKFVYFPLQVEPERNVSIDAPFYTNQLEVIKNIAKSLPVDYKLYVKEHYNMRFRDWRNISYYKEIIDLPNVRMIHPSIKPEEILKKCSLVITITSAAGLEAAFYEKPSIILADVIYSSLPSVYRLKNIEELPYAIRSSLQRKVNLTDLSKFVNLIDKNSFEFDEVKLNNEIFHRFHPAGFLINDSISMNELNSFLEENRSVFELLAIEHIKKINQHKKYTIKKE